MFERGLLPRQVRADWALDYLCPRLPALGIIWVDLGRNRKPLLQQEASRVEGPGGNFSHLASGRSHLIVLEVCHASALLHGMGRFACMLQSSC